MSGLRVLVVDDEPAIRRTLRANLVARGYDVDAVETGEEALASAAEHRPDLVILDLMLPGLSGLDVCRDLRAQSAVPILVLSARGEERAKVRALDLGADDYLTKPFDHLELMARLRSLARRSQLRQQSLSADIVAGVLSINLGNRSVWVAGNEVRLTATEYRLLEELVRHAGGVLSSQVLLERVWGEDWIGNPDYVKVFIRRLRQKLGDDAESPTYIQTERGRGYRFIAPLNRPG